jgi:hypothetical protein
VAVIISGHGGILPSVKQSGADVVSKALPRDGLTLSENCNQNVMALQPDVYKLFIF